MAITIRRASAEDAAAVHRLTVQLGYAPSEEGVLVRLAEFADAERHRVLVACTDGVMHGWIHVALRSSVESGTWAEILGFVVDRAVRGGGIGSELLRSAGDWVASRGVGRLRVRSRADRERAHGFYEGRGFRCVKTQRVMDLELSSVRPTRR